MSTTLMSKRIRIICVDDNMTILEAIELAVKMLPDIDLIGTLQSADNLTQQCAELSPDVVLLDIDMPGKNPFDAIVEMRDTCPRTRVLIYSGHVRLELIEAAIDNGAWGYVAKSDPFEVLVDAIRRVANGEFILSQTVEMAFR